MKSVSDSERRVLGFWCSCFSSQGFSPLLWRFSDHGSPVTYLPLELPWLFCLAWLALVWPGQPCTRCAMSAMKAEAAREDQSTGWCALQCRKDYPALRVVSRVCYMYVLHTYTYTVLRTPYTIQCKNCTCISYIQYTCTRKEAYPESASVLNNSRHPSGPKTTVGEWLCNWTTKDALLLCATAARRGLNAEETVARKLDVASHRNIRKA